MSPQLATKMKLLIQGWGILFLSGWLAVQSVDLVFAKTPTPTPEVILEKARLTQDITEVKSQYLSQLNQYRTIEKQYRIAQAQLESTTTLTAIDDAVTTARQAMMARNQVLLIYLQLMKLRLIEAEGVEVTHKQKVLNRIEVDQQNLLKFEEGLADITDRLDLNQKSADFVAWGAMVEETANYGLSLLLIGNLQAVYDQSLVVKKSVLTEAKQNVTSLTQVKLDQADVEAERLMAEIQPQFSELWTDLSQVDETNDGVYQHFYRKITDELNTIYAQLSHHNAYLGEMLTI